MAKELRFINAEKAYSLSDGGAPDRQTLVFGEEIEDARISHSVAVAENTTGNRYMKYEGEDHGYYTYFDNGYVLETENGSDSNYKSVNLPCHLEGWQTSTGHPFLFGGTNVDQTFIDTFYSGSDTNLDLYAIWKTTLFVRTIVSTFEPTQFVDSGIYSVNITEDLSYDTGGLYDLSPSFKQTIDYSNVSNHLTLKVNGIVNSNIVEVGVGHGCPKVLNGVRYPTYFGVKAGSVLTVGLTIYNSNYIPKYTVVSNTVMYLGYICTVGLSRDFFDKGNEFSWTNDGETWNTRLRPIRNDETLFIPIVPKPVVTVSVAPEGSGFVVGAGSYMPGSECHLTVEPAIGYEIDMVRVNGADIQKPYNFTVYQDTYVVAYFSMV